MKGFIDIHAHGALGDRYPYRKDLADPRPLCSPEDLLCLYDRIGVEKGVILPMISSEMTIGTQSNEEVLAFCATHPDRFIPGCCLDSRALRQQVDLDYADVIRYYRDRGCRVFGEFCPPVPFDDPTVEKILSGCEEAGLPLTFHISPQAGYQYGLVDAPGLPGLERALAAHPHLRFFAHSQAFWCEIAEYSGAFEERIAYPKGPVKEGRVARLMRKYPNLYGDLSAGSGNNALARDLDYAGRFLTEFQDRLLFGLDVCAPGGFVSPLADTLKTLLDTGRITSAVYEKVARENQMRELGL